MLKMTFFDTETAWDETLHEAYCTVDPRQHSHRIASKRIIAASALDIDLSCDGQISCRGIASWTEYHHGDEAEVVAGLFNHLRGQADRIAVGFGSVANDLPVLQLAAMEYGMPLPSQFRQAKGSKLRKGLPPHYDLGLALKGVGKTWNHLTEVILRLGLPVGLVLDKAGIDEPGNAAGWASLRGHVELDAALLAISMLAWQRIQGQACLDPQIAAFVVLDWLRRNGQLTAASQAVIADTCSGLAHDLSLRAPLAA